MGVPGVIRARGVKGCSSVAHTNPSGGWRDPRALGRVGRAGMSRWAASALLVVASIGPAIADAPPRPQLDDVTLLDTATWGASVSSAAELKRLGRARWLAGQLHPGADLALPADIVARIAALPCTGQPVADVVRTLDRQRVDGAALANEDGRRAAQQAYQFALSECLRAASSRTILRALYDPAQLREKMAWFWFNRFNVHAGKANIRAMVGDYLDVAIRPHALGRFRDLLDATLRHPAMLRYLDNQDNAVGHLNENYARELLELHTLGVGSGYGQQDVEAMARILTGAGIMLRQDDPRLPPALRGRLVRDGLFVFNPAGHDPDDKALLGHPIKGGGIEEIDAALDILCRHPATAKRVGRDIARFFLGDSPPDALVSRLAATFTRTDGDIAAILGTLFETPDLVRLRAGYFKPPVAYVFSALRLAYDDKVILNTMPVQTWLNRLAEGLFNRVSPDGYGLDASSWNGPGQMAVRFEIAKQIGGGPGGLFKSAIPEGPDRPAFPLLQNALYFEAWRARLGPATRAVLDEAVSPQDWNALFLSSPEFMQ